MRWNNTLLHIWLKWRSANLFLNICFVKFWMNPKVDPIWFKWRENFFLFFLVLMRWNKTLLAIWLKWRSANLFLNICFVKFWMNPKVDPIWFKWREINFLIFSRSYEVKQYSAGYLIEVEVSRLVLNICLVKFWMNPKVDPIWFKWREMTFFSRSYEVKQNAAGYLIEVEVSKLVS